MNKHKICASVFTLFMIAIVSLSVRGGKDDMDKISQSLSNAHNDIAIQESVRKEMEEELKKLESYKEDLVKYMEELNKSYDDVQKEIIILDEKIRLKEEDIDKINKTLQQSELDIQNQYNDMKLRIQYLYENGELDYLEAIMSSANITDLINKVEYISSIIKYDRQMLDELKETLATIEVIRENLVVEMTQLTALRVEQQAKSDELSRLMMVASANIKEKEDQIDEAESLAKEKEKELEALYEHLEYLEQEESRIIAQSISESISESIRQSEEESSRLAAGEKVTTQQYTAAPYEIQEGDLQRLAALIFCEAGGESYEGKLAVGTVVMNRVASKYYPNTIEGVITQPYQFSPVSVSGRYYLVLAKPLDPVCLKAAEEILYGGVRLNTWMYFRTVSLAIETGKIEQNPHGKIIGNHFFY